MSESAIPARDNLVSYPTGRSDSFFAQTGRTLRWALCAFALTAWVLLCTFALFFSAPLLHAQMQAAAHASATAPVSLKPDLIVNPGGPSGGGPPSGCTSNCGGTFSTTTALTLSATGSIALGTAETLTASVTTPNGGSTANVAPGTITFFDGKKIVGKAQLVPNTSSPAAGTATIHRRFSLGSHSISASFAGVTFYVSTGNSIYTASSSAAQSLTVTGTYPSSTTIGDPTSTSPYTLAGTVASEGFPAPTGTISFENASNNNAVLGTASLGAAVPGFASNVTYGAGSNPSSVAVGDFNGDGIPDLAVADSNSPGTIQVLLGNGDGTFKAAVSYSVPVSYPGSIAVGDFNNDGNLDLVVSGSGSGNSDIGVLLGNGDGTFQPAVGYNAGVYPAGVAVGDFNGDGNLDLAVADASSNYNVSVLLGNGDGTFGSPTSVAVVSEPFAVAVGDFNGDGKLDLVAANGNGNSVSVLLGNGDGTFQTQVSYTTGNGPNFIAVGDVNGDGYLDLAVANTNDNTVSVLLGNGNGTFQTQQTFATGVGPTSVAIADLNGDGKPDLAVANYGAVNQQTGMFTAGNTVSVLLGDGDGAFQTQTTYTVGKAPSSVAARDLNGDGAPDLAVANGAFSIVLLNQFTASATLNSVTIPSSGTQNIFASYAGDTAYAGSNSGNLPLQGSQIATVTTVSSSLDPSNYGQSVTFTAVLSSNGTADTSADGQVSFSGSVSGSLGTEPVSNGVAVLVTGSLPAGTQNVTASYAGYGNYGPSSGYVAQTVNQPAPTIAFAVGTQTFGEAPFIVSASSNSTGAFTYSVVSGPATINGSTVTLTGIGTVVLQASQVAAGNYDVGTQQASFTVNAGAPTITFAVGTQTYGEAPFLVSASSNSTGAFAYSVVSGPATINGGTVTLTGIGPVVLQASQVAAGNYAVGKQQASFTVNAAAPRIAFALATQTYGGPPVALAASSNSTGAFTYQVLSGPAIISGSTVTFTGAGPVMLQASQAAAGNYAAGTAQTGVLVNKASSSVLLSATASQTDLGTTAMLTARVSPQFSGTPTGTVTFYAGTAPLASAPIVGGVATLTTGVLPTGSNSLTAVYSGDGNFTGNTSNTFVVASIAPTAVRLQFVSTNLVYPLPPAFEVTLATSGRIAPTGSVEILDGSKIVGRYPVLQFARGHIIGLVLPALNVSQHSMTALYSGDKNYAPGISATVTLTVAPGPVNLRLRCNRTRLKAGQSLSCETFANDGVFPVSGTLDYSATGGASGAVMLNKGQATLTLPNPPVGKDALTVAYAAQGNYQAARPVSVAFTVIQ